MSFTVIFLKLFIGVLLKPIKLFGVLKTEAFRKIQLINKLLKYFDFATLMPQLDIMTFSFICFD